MASLTGDQLVLRTRELLQVFGDADAYRDGFDDDADTDPTSILAGVNEFLSLLQPTGVRVGETTIATVISQRAYALALTVGEIYSLAYGNNPLRPSTIRAWDDRHPNWRNEASGTPEEYAREGNRILLRPKPSAVGTLTIESTLPIPEITEHTGAGGEVEYVPESHQRFIPYGGAVILAHIDAENKAHLLRKSEYQRYALWLIGDLIRICRPQDFGRGMSLDTFYLPPQFEYDRQQGMFTPAGGIYAPLGLDTAPIGAVRGDGDTT